MAEVVCSPQTPESTEVRCQEKTRGGLRYEVILGEPDVKATPPSKKTVSPKNSMSIQDIEDKLKAAEERRQQLEANKIASLSAKMVKIEEASRKKDEQTNQFIASTREALEQKMENTTGKREAYITGLKTKLKDHIENVEKTRLTLEQQTEEVRSAIEEKLKTASVQRDENIKKMLERLREHEEQVTKVRTANAIKFQQLETAIQEKLDHAKNRREHKEQEQKEKLRSLNNKSMEVKQTVESILEERKLEVNQSLQNKLTKGAEKRAQEIQKIMDTAKKHNEHMAEVKQTIESSEEKLKTEKVTLIENKLSAAEQKREQEMQRKLENIKKNEKRAETVRQNKANILANKTTTPSSG